MRLRFALAVLVLALLATVAWVYGDRIWGSRGTVPPAAGAGDSTGLAGTKSEPGADDRTKGMATTEGAAERTEITGDTEAAHTSLRGIFVSPTGVWPGGGQVGLFKAPKLPEGGAMGMFSAGMQMARLKRRGSEKEGGKDSKRSAAARRKAEELESLVRRGKPVQTVELDAHGGFVLHNPPAGRFLVRIQHPHLIDAKKVEVELHLGRHIDLGVLPTRLAGSLLVLVSDAEGQPVSGAHLELHQQMDMSDFMKPGAAIDILGMIQKLVPRSGKTDARGAHVFAGLGDDVPWTLSVSSERLVDQHRPVAVLPGRENLVRVELHGGARMDVRVLDPDGKPRRRARLKVTFPDLRKPNPVAGVGFNQDRQVVSKTYHTGTDGRQSMYGLPAGRCQVEVLVAGFLQEKQEVVFGEDPGKDQKAELVFRLDPGATITGQVIDENGDPVPDARVKYVKPQGLGILGLGFSDVLDQVQIIEVERRGLRVDKEGRFTLGGMQPNEAVQLLAAAPGCDANKSRRLHAGATGVVIKLLRRAELVGVVRTAEAGKPVTDFSVDIQKRSFMVLDVSYVSEEFDNVEDGSFLVEDVPRGRYKVVVKAKGRASWAKTVNFSRGGKVDIGEIRLEQPAAVEGVVVDPLGAPVPEASVRAGKGGQLDSLMVAQVLGQTVVKTDALGRFRVENLSGRQVRLLVDKQGFAPLRGKPVPVRKGETTKGVVLELTAGGSIKGRLVDAAGKPIEGWIAQATHTSGLGVQVSRTGANGVFRIANLAPGTHKVDCMPSDYMKRAGDAGTNEDLARGEVNLGKLMTTVMKWVVSDRVVVRAGEESELSLVFQEPEAEAGTKDLVTVSGHVRIGGRDLEEGIVFLLEAGATVQSHLGHVRKGTFKLRGVRPGNYRLRVQASVFSGTLGRPQEVKIPRKPTHTLTLDLPAGRLAGRVVYAEDGKPAGGVVLSLGSATDRSVHGDRLELGEGTQLADSEGCFKFEGLPAGTYHILAKEMRLLASGSRSRSGRLDGLRLRDSEQRDGLVLQVDKGGTILVRVTDTAGTRANALVRLLAADGKPMDLFHRALTEPDGTVTLSGVPAGSYRVGVNAPRAAAKVSDVIEIQSGVEREVVVRLPVGIQAFLELGKKLDEDHAGETLRYSVWRADGVLVRSGRLTIPHNLNAF
ncbi:MAG: MSCRAMM family protein, partial [Planctomycetota bacterium]